MLTLAQLAGPNVRSASCPANALATLFVQNPHLFIHLPCPDKLFPLRAVEQVSSAASIPVEMFYFVGLTLKNRGCKTQMFSSTERSIWAR